MAKIILPSFDELILSDQKARTIYNSLQEYKNNDSVLNTLPVTIDHSYGLWIGTMNDLDKSKFMLDKQVTHTHKFKSREDLERFHKEYGYAAFSSYTLTGYGIVDCITQFMIKTGQAKFEGVNLVVLSSPYKDKWNDLWFDYESKLNEFNELD
jgi:hypothetical protein